MVDLNFSENLIGDNGISGICKIMLTLQDTLEQLHLTQNQITEKGAKKLGKTLESMKNMKVLRLNCNPIGTLGAEAILQVRVLPYKPCLSFGWKGQIEVEFEKLKNVATNAPCTPSIYMMMSRKFILTIDDEWRTARTMVRVGAIVGVYAPIARTTFFT